MANRVDVRRVESAESAEVPEFDVEPEVGSAVYVAIACDDETVSPLELGRRGKAPETATARRRMAEGDSPRLRLRTSAGWPRRR